MNIILLDYQPKPRQHLYCRSSIQVLYTIAWTTPMEDAWKLNFAACGPNELRHGGAGYVLRKHHGLFKAARAEPLPNDFSHFEVILVAFELGLREAIAQGIDYLEVEGYNVHAIAVVFDDKATLMPSKSSIAHKCHKLVQAFKLVKFHPVTEFSNRAAIKLAEMATDEAGMQHWIIEPPPEIATILIEDVTGYWHGLF
ncbi:Hypothetical predicted protein [Olea europaea subsp. europaea]|uniref:RNase H type-1 domain-containing protein n=1 Tax=Olea europaea subsp. europaea TaxID=158383 RepID=A0A8S0QZ27_OLEEU|nr:Hypothetical predicted protein [Olea europaea subsp. europaea]